MSKIYNKYLELKSNNSNNSNNSKTLYLFQSGIFFIFVADDAIKASTLFNLKLSNLNDTVLKCAFPINSFEKYEQLAKNSGFNLQVIDFSQNKSLSPNVYLNNEKVKSLIDEIIKTDMSNLSISNAYDFLMHIQNTFASIAESGGKCGK